MSKAYPKYKPSGVEWLGDVPEHWGVKKLKYVSNTNTGFAFSSDDYTDEGIPLVRIGDILQDGNVDIANAKKLPDEYLRTYRFVVVNKNDMLMAMTGATIGKAGRYQFDEKGLLNQRVCKFVPFKIFADYFWFILKSEQYAEHIKLTGFGGAQPNISDVQLLDFHFALPPLPEQQAIAAFLDRETGRIDALIAKKERLLELLAEQRTALISRAVTKGLDASVRLKPSGVEWLGDVPEHWKVLSLRYLFHIKAGGDLKEEFYSEERTDLHKYPIYTNSIKSDEAYGFTSKAFFKANSITVTGRGEIGYAVYRDHEFDAIIRLLVLTPKNSHPCKYYSYFINAMLVFFGGSTAVSQLSTEQISPYKVFSPPLPEQQAIAAFLDRETAKIDALSAKVTTVIERLKEYRTALISSAVTGKIDVREAV